MGLMYYVIFVNERNNLVREKPMQKVVYQDSIVV